LAQRVLGGVAQEASGEVVLGVEGPADADHVGLATLENGVDLLTRPDPADREHGDRHRLLGPAEQVPAPDWRERVAPCPASRAHAAASPKRPANSRTSSVESTWTGTPRKASRIRSGTGEAASSGPRRADA